MNSPAVDISAMLILSSSATGLTEGTDLFIADEPELPNAVVTIYDTGGASPQPGYTYLRPTVQVRIRGAKMDYATAYTLAETIRNVLHGFPNQNINGTKYIAIYGLGDIQNLGDDENGRPIFTVNFIIHRGDV